jgi:DNA-binding transcriptional ArsR family regulator
MPAPHRLLPEDPPDADADPAVVDLVSAPAAVEALGAETARSVLARIYDEPATASAVADAVGASIQTVRYHLDRLLDAGLVEVGGTRYSSKGFEMDVYVPAHRPLVVVAGGDTDHRAVEAALDGGTPPDDDPDGDPRDDDPDGDPRDDDPDGDPRDDDGGRRVAVAGAGD